MTPSTEPMRSTSTTAASLPYLAAPADEQPRDLAAEVRKLLANEPLTRDEIQDGLDAAGLGHVPLGQIAAALDEIGATVDSEERWSLRSIEDAEALVARRADVLEAMFRRADSDDPVTAQALADDIDGGDLVDVITEAADALVDAGALYRFDDTGAITYDLGDGIYDKIIRHGALFIARATLPELASDAGAQAELAEQRAILAEEQRDAAEQRLARLHSYLRAGGMSADAIAAVMDPPAADAAPAAPTRDTFEWTKIEPWSDGAELSLLRLAEKVRNAQKLADSVKEGAVADHASLSKENKRKLTEIEQDIAARNYVRRERAYTETLWGEGLIITRRASDDVELERKPIPRGTQRPMFAAKLTEAAPSPKAESVAPAPVDAAAEASADAAKDLEARAAGVRAKVSTKGELTVERVRAEAEALLRGFGADGIDAGKDDEAAVNAIARRAHGKERGKLPNGLAAMVRLVLDGLLADGRAVRRGDAIVWAEMASEAAE